MFKKETSSRFSSLVRMIFSALLITLALSSSACSNSTGSAAGNATSSGTSITGSAQ